MGTDEAYLREVEDFRRAKDHFFKTGEDSPIPNRHMFKGLKYFNPDPAYSVAAHFVPLPKPERLRMLTSKGVEQDYLRVGHLEFSLYSRSLRLAAYRPADAHGRHDSLFVPFRDATSGKESYGAARYLDLELQPSGQYILDFNLAYNPYCAYSDDYVCPLPPHENSLPVAIQAGEKAYEDPLDHGLPP